MQHAAAGQQPAFSIILRALKTTSKNMDYVCMDVHICTYVQYLCMCMYECMYVCMYVST